MSKGKARTSENIEIRLRTTSLVSKVRRTAVDQKEPYGQNSLRKSERSGVRLAIMYVGGVSPSFS